MVQERIDDWWEYAKDLARAERELQIERWVYISIEYKDEAGTSVQLHLFHWNTYNMLPFFSRQF